MVYLSAGNGREMECALKMVGEWRAVWRARSSAIWSFRCYGPGSLSITWCQPVLPTLIDLVPSAMKHSITEPHGWLFSICIMVYICGVQYFIIPRLEDCGSWRYGNTTKSSARQLHTWNICMQQSHPEQWDKLHRTLESLDSSDHHFPCILSRHQIYTNLVWVSV